MRQIKFRAWGVRTKVMHYLTDKNDKLSVIYDNEFWKVMQFTGLKDRQGKEIWEGDIIRFDGHTYEDKFTARIIFNSGGFMPLRQDGISDFLGNYKYTEVLGNIYKNPELLKEDERG